MSQQTKWWLKNGSVCKIHKEQNLFYLLSVLHLLLQMAVHKLFNMNWMNLGSPDWLPFSHLSGMGIDVAASMISM
jgi:hypothetical protein